MLIKSLTNAVEPLLGIYHHLYFLSHPVSVFHRKTRGRTGYELTAGRGRVRIFVSLTKEAHVIVSAKFQISNTSEVIIIHVPN